MRRRARPVAGLAHGAVRRTPLRGQPDRGSRGPQIEQITPHVWRTTGTQQRELLCGQRVGQDTGDRLRLSRGARPFECGLLQAISPPRVVTQPRRTQTHRASIASTSLISHFHDDHVCGVPLLQRLHGTQCWATEAFADLLAQPEAHCFPCDWPPIHIDRRTAHGDIARWEEYEFCFAPMATLASPA